MASTMEEQDDFDFESLLDEALGIPVVAEKQLASQEVAAPPYGTCTNHKDSVKSASLVSYDQPSPSPSPAASPVHCVQYHAPCSPCWSSSSMQMHASLQESNAAVDDQPGLYSPVRESGSPAPEQQYPPIAMPGPMPGLQQLPQHNSPQQSVNIASLPREVQQRMLCFLSADALTTLAQTCKHFSTMCSEPVLWRRLFCFRWGKKHRQQNQHSWKARYLERDLSELRAAAGGAGAAWAGAGGGDAMQDIFVQAHIARRQQALPRTAIDDLMLVEDDEVAARVVAWRKSRGFDSGPGGLHVQPERPADIGQGWRCAPEGSGHRAGRHAGGASSGSRRVMSVQLQQQNSSSHHNSSGSLNGATGDGDGSPQKPAAAAAGAEQRRRQGASSSSSARWVGTGSGSTAGAKRPRQGRRWTQIGNVFCDEMTGWVHVCDETCSEKIIEPSSGLLVCPISGQVSDRMMTCAEEAAEEGDRDEEARAAQDEDYGGERGRLARAFAAGYYCSNERELMRTCGVRLSR